MNLTPIIKVFKISMDKCGCEGSFGCPKLRTHIKLLKVLARACDFKERYLDKCLKGST